MAEALSAHSCTSPRRPTRRKLKRSVFVDGQAHLLEGVELVQALALLQDRQDELDQDHDQTVLTQKDGYWEADGWTQIADLERALDIKFPDELDANTLSGLFMVRMGRVPEEGDVVEEQGYRFTIQSMSGRRVNMTRIEPLDPGPASTDGDTAGSG